MFTNHNTKLWEESWKWGREIGKRERERETETDRDRHRETERTQRERHTHTQRDTERHRETQRDTERHRERHTERKYYLKQEAANIHTKTPVLRLEIIRDSNTGDFQWRLRNF